MNKKAKVNNSKAIRLVLVDSQINKDEKIHDKLDQSKWMVTAVESREGNSM